MKQFLPSFLSTKDKQAKALVVDSLATFIDSPASDILDDYGPDEILLYKNSKAVFKRQKIECIMNALKASNDALEFKVAQELFGHDPNKMFKTLLDFWMNHVASDLESCLDDLMMYLCINEDDMNPVYESQLAFNV